MIIIGSYIILSIQKQETKKVEVYISLSVSRPFTIEVGENRVRIEKEEAEDERRTIYIAKLMIRI